MNDPYYEESVGDSVAECGAEMEECVRRNPGTSLLVAVGVGIAIGLIVRALRPEPTPQSRIAHLLEDLEERLRDAAEPIVRKAGSLASESATVLQDGIHGGEARLDRLVRDLRHRFRKILS